MKTQRHVNVETTGLDPAVDEILELAMTPFSYGSDGRITAVGASFEGLRQRTDPIPAHITAITGIDDAMVTDVSEADKAAELDFLARDIGLGDREPLVCRVDAYDRFSERC